MCKAPNYMIWNGSYTNDDKPKLTFIGHHQYQTMLDLHGLPFVQVPCGKCLECRIQHSRQWADRCVLEAKKYKDNYFVTLTYDDEHLPAKNSLCPDDLVNFLKRLRKHFPNNKIRFLACGEYGTKGGNPLVPMRPHYHLILFNCPLDDLSYNFKKFEDGRLVNHLRPVNKGDLKFSDTIYKLWYKDREHPEPLGMISVGTFTYESARYVSQYVLKKADGADADKWKQLGLYPEFIRMSRRPGIGAEYFDTHDEMHNEDHLIIPASGNAHIVGIPRYFDKLFIKKYGDDVFDPIRIRRHKKRHQKELNYLHGSSNYEHDADIRDHRLRKFKQLRDAI